MPRRGPTRTDGSCHRPTSPTWGARARGGVGSDSIAIPRATTSFASLSGCAARGVDGWPWRFSPGTRGQVRCRLAVCCEKPATDRAGATVAREGSASREWSEVARCVETGWRSVVVRAAREGVRCATSRCHRRGFASPRRGVAGKRSRLHRLARQPEAPLDTWAATRICAAVSVRQGGVGLVLGLPNLVAARRGPRRPVPPAGPCAYFDHAGLGWVRSGGECGGSPKMGAELHHWRFAPRPVVLKFIPPVTGGFELNPSDW